MTVAPSAVETVYSLIGTNLGPFATGWPYAGHADISVHLTLADHATLLFEGTDYTVVGPTPLAGGGSVTLSAALAGAAWPSGATLCLTRASQTGQPTALGDAVGFSPKAVEAALDFVERQVQDVWAPLTRALARPPGGADFDARGGKIIALADGVSLTDAASLGQARSLAAAPLAAIAAFLAGQTVANVKIMFSSAFAKRTGEPDDTARLQRLLDAAGNGGYVWIEPGAYTLSATLHGYTDQQVHGSGGVNTQFVRSTAYGDTIRFANIGNGCVRGIFFNHANVPANSSIALLARATDGSAHVNIQAGQGWTVSDNLFWRLPYGVIVDGSARFCIERNTFVGVWDPQIAGAQEGIAGVSLGPNGYVQIGRIEGNHFGGVPSVPRNITWTANDGALTVSTANNCGAQVGVQIYQCEDLQITGNYFGGQSLSNIATSLANGATAIEWRIQDNFFDGAGAASPMIALATVHDGTMLNGLVIGDNHFNGEFLSYQAIQMVNASGAGSQPAVVNFTISGNTSMATVGSFLTMYNARGGTIFGNSITGYNCRNVSPGSDVNYCAAIWGSASATGISVGGNTVGGGVNNAAASSFCYQGVSGVGLVDLGNTFNGCGPDGQGVGASKGGVVAVTNANYQLNGYETVVLFSNLTAAQAVLPPAHPAVDYRVKLKDASGTWAAHGLQFSGTLDGVANPIFSTNRQCVEILYHGGAWYQIG